MAWQEFPGVRTGLGWSDAMHDAEAGTRQEVAGAAALRHRSAAADAGVCMSEYINDGEVLAGHDRSPGLACLQCGAVCARDDLRLGILA